MKRKLLKIGTAAVVDFYARPWKWWDAWFSYRIAKDPSVRAQSLDESLPTFRKHLRWCRNLARHKRSHAYVIVDNVCGLGSSYIGIKQKVGQVRYDWDHENKQWEVGIALVPRARGKGLGTWALNATAPIAAPVQGMVTFTTTEPDSYPILATIKWSNRASMVAFERADYKLNSELSDTKLAKMVRAAQ